MSESSSLNSFDMVKDECSSLLDFEHADAPEVLVEQRKSPKMEELLELVEKELAEQDLLESEAEELDESDAEIVDEVESESDESNVCADSTDDEEDVLSELSESNSESDAESVVNDELLVELMKPVAQADQKILEPVTIDIPEMVPEVKELVIPEGKVLVDQELLEEVKLLREPKKLVIPEGKVLVDQALLEEVKLLREPKELVIPEGKVLVDESLLKEVEDLRASDEVQKRTVDEKTTELEELTKKSEDLEKKVDTQKAMMRAMRTAVAKKELRGKWRLVSMNTPYLRDTGKGIRMSRRILNIVAPMHISLVEDKMTTWQQIFGKRFNETSSEFEVFDAVPAPKTLEAEYIKDGKSFSVFWMDSPIVTLSTGKKVYIDQDDLLMRSASETFQAYQKVQKKTDIFRAAWKAAQVVTGKYF